MRSFSATAARRVAFDPLPAGDDRPALRTFRVAAVVALAVILTAITATLSLEQAWQSGRLAVPPLYDDVVYFLSAVQWLNAAPSQGMLANLYALLHQHAPFSTLSAILGFTLQPDGYAGPYAVNAVIILVFLLGIARLAWRSSLVDIATCLIGAACVPVFWHTMTEARPDLPCGLALGLAAGAVLYRPFLQRSRRSLLVLGVLCGLAVSIKPSAFPASLLCIGAIAAAELAHECLQSGATTFRAGLTRAGPAALWFAGGLLAGLAAILGAGLVGTIRYIVVTVITNRDFWVIDEPFGPSLLHYLIGFEGRVALDGWLWAGLALAGLRLGLAWLNDRRDLGAAASVLIAGLVAFAIPTLANVKSYFLGAMFYGVFMVTMTLNFCAVVAALEEVIARLAPKPGWRQGLSSALHLAPLALVAALFAVNGLTGRVGLATGLTADQIRDIRNATERVWSLLQQGSQGGKVPVVGFSSPYPVTPTAIQLSAAQAHLRLDARGEYFNRTLEAAEKALLAADVAVVTSTMPHNLPGPRMGDELIGRMDANPGMCLVDSIALRATREMRIYRRSDGGCAPPAPGSR